MKHSGTKTINTTRLVLRRFSLDDTKAMFHNWASDDEVTKFLTWPPHDNEKVSQEIINDWVNHYEQPDYYNWAIVLKDINEPIGSISVVIQNDQVKLAQLGYCIGKKWWHKGYMSETVNAVIGYLLNEEGYQRVEARHDLNNPNSGAVMRKCGMKFEGIHRKSDANNQGINDCCYYSILSEEYNQEDDWDLLYKAAKSVQNDRVLTPFIEAGGVAAAILSETHQVHTGVCIDTASSLGMCAERNAISTMITQGEHKIKKVVAIMPDGQVGPPCGACREYMMQLDANSGDIEILLDYTTKQTMTLKELVPHWWGYERYEEGEVNE